MNVEQTPDDSSHSAVEKTQKAGDFDMSTLRQREHEIEQRMHEMAEMPRLQRIGHVFEYRRIKKELDEIFDKGKFARAKDEWKETPPLEPELPTQEDDSRTIH